MKPLAPLLALLLWNPFAPAKELELRPDDHVVLLGGGFGSRMMHYGHFETELHRRYPQHRLFIRNICDEGDTPAFRPHSGRPNPWAFDGGEKFRTLAKARDRWAGDSAAGFFQRPDEWLTRLQADLIVAFFGYSESFDGPNGLANFKAELEAFITHTLKQQYNGESAPRLALVSPLAFQDLSKHHRTPDGIAINANLALYTKAMGEVAAKHGVHFVDLHTPGTQLFRGTDRPLSRDGALLSDAGYRAVTPLLASRLFGKRGPSTRLNADTVRDAVQEKNWVWRNFYKIPNGVHVFGRRHRPHGPANYPFELKKLEQLVGARDRAIWALLAGKAFDLAAEDAKTDALPPVGKPKQTTYLPAEESLKTLQVPEGYEIALFADESRFPELANPVQLSFDNQGRLWVATMPSYPHWRPGDPRPDDKLLILVDTDRDGKADEQIVFADGLHLPMGFEFSHDGVYVSQGTSLVFLADTDGDDRADVREVVMSGFDDHDTHHAISGFCADPSGAIMMGEGTFLHSHVETAYGPIRSSNGGFFRYDPTRRKLERSVRLSIPNPWGIAYDGWGQNFFADTSDPNARWMLQGEVRVGYGNFAPLPPNLLSVRVRPTSGLEFVSSRHFPDAVQGDLLINNTIGFLGTKQHRMADEGTGYASSFRHDLVTGGDRNFRPVDMEFAPDGSLYLVDWHNALIGHMQHNARDPNRDHGHGRVYRITFPGRPLVEAVQVAGASIDALCRNLELPEYRTRYRTRRELRGRDPGQVLAGLKSWLGGLNPAQARYEHHLVEALWVQWGLDRVEHDLLTRVLAAKDFHARAAGVRVLRYSGHRIAGQAALLKQAAMDGHGRVRLEAIVAASWLNGTDGLAVLDAAMNRDAAAPKPAVDEPVFAKPARDGALDFAHPVLTSKKVDRITVLLPGTQRTLNLAELEAISGGRNVIKQARGSQSSAYDASMRSDKLTDGDKDTFAHSREGEANPWFRFDFPAPLQLETVRIWNRRGYETRFNGGQVIYALGDQEIARVALDANASPAGAGSMDRWIQKVYAAAFQYVKGEEIAQEAGPQYETALTGTAKKSFFRGAELYGRDGHCGTCHQPDGKGLPEAQFPPIAGTQWINGSEERLIKLALHGLHGPIEVQGKTYPGLVPMTAFKMLNDRELADVLTFVRNAFGNRASVVEPGAVAKVRAATRDQESFYQPAELLKAHPHGSK